MTAPSIAARCAAARAAASDRRDPAPRPEEVAPQVDRTAPRVHVRVAWWVVADEPPAYDRAKPVGTDEAPRAHGSPASEEDLDASALVDEAGAGMVERDRGPPDRREQDSEE